MSGRRQYQDYTAWHDWGTQQFWRHVQQSPEAADEIFSQWMSRLGLRCPSEVTSASVAAGILAASRPPCSVDKEQANEMFDRFKVKFCTCICDLFANER
jgi:hypothetical protein